MNSGKLPKVVVPLHSLSGVEFLGRVGQELVDNGTCVTYIPQNRHIGNVAASILPKERLRLEYLDYEPKASLEVLCDKYDIVSPRQLVFPQMVYERRYDTPSYRHHWFAGTESLDYEYYMELLHRTLAYLDTLYEDGEGGVPLQYQGAEVLRRTLQRVADHHEYRSIRASFSPVPGELLFRGKEQMKFPAFASTTYAELSEDHREEARRFRETVVGNEDWIVGGPDRNEPLLQNVRRKSRRIREFGIDIGPVAADWLRRRFAKPILGRVAEQFYMKKSQSQQFINSNDYVFYPVQYPRESRITMRAPQFYNQMWLIEYLSRSLPQGCELVVKDHPHHVGALPLSHVRAIGRYANALAPDIPARNVVKEANAVVTVNNTVGYEAIMYGKPVLTLGNAFYSGSGYTRDVSSVGELATELRNAVQSSGLTDREVVEFAHGILESSYDGEWANGTESNVRAFVDGMCEYIADCG